MAKKTNSRTSNRPVGRPSSYTDEAGNIICTGIASGQSLAAICREHGYAYSTVIAWLRDYAEFQSNYMRARLDQADADADAVGDIAARVLAGEIEPNAARVAIDALKWAAGKRKPLVYGDKQQIEHTGAIKHTVAEMSDDDLAAIAVGKK